MEWLDYNKLLRDKCKKAGVPFSATFELTPFCNFNCNMCYIHLTPEQAKTQGELLNTEQWIRLAKETKAAGALWMEITGGEAVTRMDFSVLYETFVKMGFMINLRTNGYLLSGERLKLLNRLKPNRVSITLYGATDETYQKICGISDGFSIVERNIFALRDAGIKLQLTVTMTKDNIDDKKALIDWAIKNDLYIHFFGGLFTPIRAAKRPINHLRIDYGTKTDYEMISREIPDREKYLKPFWMCTGYGIKFCISWDGRMTLCNCLPSVWSNPLTDGIQGAFRSLYGQLDSVKRPDECFDCPYIDFCGNCPARLLSDTGDHEKTCEEVCAIAKQCYSEYIINKLQNDRSESNGKEVYSDCDERGLL